MSFKPPSYLKLSISFLTGRTHKNMGYGGYPPKMGFTNTVG